MSGCRYGTRQRRTTTRRPSRRFTDEFNRDAVDLMRPIVFLGSGHVELHSAGFSRVHAAWEGRTPSHSLVALTSRPIGL